MATSPISSHSKPGRPLQFPYKMEMRLRDDQRRSLIRIATTLELSVTEVIRWLIDEGVAAIEGAPTYKILKGHLHDTDDHV